METGEVCHRLLAPLGRTLAQIQRFQLTRYLGSLSHYSHFHCFLETNFFTRDYQRRQSQVHLWQARYYHHWWSATRSRWWPRWGSLTKMQRVRYQIDELMEPAFAFHRRSYYCTDEIKRKQDSTCSNRAVSRVLKCLPGHSRLLYDRNSYVGQV